jgi:hypothetical protein
VANKKFTAKETYIVWVLDISPISINLYYNPFLVESIVYTWIFVAPIVNILASALD